MTNENINEKKPIDEIPRAQYIGQITLGDSITPIPCAVLNDGTRLLSDRGVTKALGGKRGGAHWRRKKDNIEGANLPVYLSANNLRPFISDDLAASLGNPIEYRGIKGGAISNGLEATLLPKVCEVWLKARDAGKLLPSQQHIALAADTLIRGLAYVGIVALVDEATGYQEIREKDALQKLLSIYLSDERLKWAKMFPDEYYRQLFRLKGWAYNPMDVKRPKYVGKLTNQLVYEKLPPRVLDELKKLNPVKNKKTYRREATHHQHLSADIGQPDLRDHLLQLIAIMRVSPNWSIFMRNFARAFPPAEGEQLSLFEDSEADYIDIKDANS